MNGDEAAAILAATQGELLKIHAHLTGLMEELQQILATEVSDEDAIEKWYLDPQDWLTRYGPRGFSQFKRHTGNAVRAGKEASADGTEGRTAATQAGETSGPDHGGVNPHRSTSGFGRIA